MSGDPSTGIFLSSNQNLRGLRYAQGDRFFY